jgi:uncharacterized protein (DUF1501 family)
VLPTWLADTAGALTPIAPTDGLLVVVTLAGGNDSLNTLVPRSGALRSRYEQLRGPIALAASTLRPATAELGLHPSLPKLAARYTNGKVALIQGVGKGALDLSHFTSMATVMAGTAGSSRSTGWLGRYLDEVTEWDSGLRGASVGGVVPLHMVGTRAEVTSLPNDATAPWGTDTARWEELAYEALRTMSAAPSAHGPWADRVAASTSGALDVARAASGVLLPKPTVRGLSSDLTIAARLLNAGLGTRIVASQLGGLDTHSSQLKTHAEKLAELDTGLDTFFQVLRPDLAAQTTVLVVSEFGRRAAVNVSLGTDHGNAGMAMLVGERVRGGLHGTLPSLTTLDSSGSLSPTVDFRSVYATVLERWLAADATELLGAAYPQLDLFTGSPGAAA